MKLLILTTVYPRGKTEPAGHKVHGKFIRDFAVEWAAQGHHVHVLTPHSLNTRAEETLDGVRVYRFHYFFRQPWETLTYGDGIPHNIKRVKNQLLVPFLAAAFWRRGVSLARRFNIDVINAHWAVPNGVIALWVKPFTGARVVTTVYGAELFPVAAGRMKILRPALTFALARADVVAGISRATVRAAVALSRRPDIHHIPDGIDLEYYRPGPKHPALLNKYNCAGRQVIFFSGRMVDRKGHRTLLEAMRPLRRRLPDARLILGGKGPLFNELAALRQQWQLQDNVEMPGFIPEADMVPLLQSADLFVLPSRVDRHGDTEGSATAALEAMACGTPAVISDVGGNRGAIEDGRGALYCRPNNPDDLAAKIVALLGNPKQYPAMSAAARAFVAANYSWPHIVARYIRLLNHGGSESDARPTVPD
ncbi:MAG: glycosyltransferase family 4 protein [Anaerolineae bacterium]